MTELWAPSEVNLPTYQEKPMSSTKWRAAIFEIYEKLNHVRLMIPIHNQYVDEGKILAVVDGASAWVDPFTELNISPTYFEKDINGNIMPI